MPYHFLSNGRFKLVKIRYVEQKATMQHSERSMNVLLTMWVCAGDMNIKDLLKITGMLQVHY